MITKFFSVISLGSILLSCSCSGGKKVTPEQCLGSWEMLDDPTNTKRIILKPDGIAEFVKLRVRDFGRNEKEALTAKGTWKLMPNNSVIELWYPFKGGDYGDAGSLRRENGGLELWFSVGDPDDFVWKRFRLMN